MPVFEGSRYENVEYTAIVGKDLITRKYLHLRESMKAEDVNPSWVLHTVNAGDELDHLAYKYSGQDANKSKNWWVIADVNNVLWPLDVETGTSLIIPTEILNTRGF